MKPSAPWVIRRTFPTITWSQARQYRAQIDGKVQAFYAEDSVDAVRIAQQRGNLNGMEEDHQ